MPSATATLETTGWDEQPAAEWDGGKITRATVTQRASGDVTGEAATEFVMAYAADGTASYVGLLRVTGSLGGAGGSFVLESLGGFDGGAASGTVRVVSGSGTGALAGLRGDGKFHAPKGPTATLTLDYTLG
jgi:Protein of unknown function (DUF3224)